MTENEMQAMTPIRVAFIIDNVVADVLHTDERLAAIFLSDPVVVDITNLDNVNLIRSGATYDPATNIFVPAEVEEQPSIRINAADIVIDED